MDDRSTTPVLGVSEQENYYLIRFLLEKKIIRLIFHEGVKYNIFIN